MLLNEKAGGVGPGDRARLDEALSASFERHEIIGVDAVSSALFTRDVDVIIALGGDGTARALAAAAPREGPPLILLPGGTLNVLPRALYGERSWPEALSAALEQGVVQRLPCGRANGEPFFVAAIFGGPTLLARAREAMREGRYLRALRRLNLYARRAVTHRLRARPAVGDRMRRARAIGVLCPVFSGALAADDFEWVRLERDGLIDMARLGLRSALGPGWREDDAVDLRRCTRGDIVSLGLIPATLDGEPRTFLSRVQITFEREGPLVVAVPDSASAEEEKGAL